MSVMLFFSRYCKYSMDFLDIIDNCQVESMKICTDRDPGTKKRNPIVERYNITAVPSLIYNDNLYVGKNAFLWVKRFIEKTGGNIDEPREGNRQDFGGNQFLSNNSNLNSQFDIRRADKGVLMEDIYKSDFASARSDFDFLTTPGLRNDADNPGDNSKQAILDNNLADLQKARESQDKIFNAKNKQY